MASSKSVHLFNCDHLYDLRIIERCLLEVESKLPFKLSIHHHVFPLQEMRRLAEEIVKMDMDYAVFVVHANESRLSINEKGAGIGYERIYSALQQRTGDKVLVVVGGDNHYDGEENTAVLSDWVKYKISSQFSEEYMNGVRSFIFSWKEKPNPIHYQAVEHFFLKRGEEFQPPYFQPPDFHPPVFQPPIKVPVFQPPVWPPDREELYHFILLENSQIIYKSSSDGVWQPEPQIIQNAIVPVEDDRLVRISRNNLMRATRVKETMCHTGFWPSYLPYILQYIWQYILQFLPSYLYSPKPSGEIKMISLLVNGQVVGPINHGLLPFNVSRNLERLYRDIPFAVVKVYESNGGIYTKAYHFESFYRRLTTLIPQWVKEKLS